jgi:two-component system sensor histidine kinase BaeS
LGRLVDDLNTLAIAESGQLSLVNEELDIADLLDDVASAFGSQAESAGIALTVTVDGNSPFAVVADAGRLQQVLGNLVSNAIRHTGDGGTITL